MVAPVAPLAPVEPVAPVAPLVPLAPVAPLAPTGQYLCERVHCPCIARPTAGAPPCCALSVQPHVRSSCEMLQHEYDIMLYGGVLERLTEELESKFQYPAPPVVFNNRKTAKLLFGDNQCLLADKTLCLPPSHPYSAVRGLCMCQPSSVLPLLQGGMPFTPRRI
jgi:hypothetical protein